LRGHFDRALFFGRRFTVIADRFGQILGTRLLTGDVGFRLGTEDETALELDDRRAILNLKNA